jgi:hypothetical protein
MIAGAPMDKTSRYPRPLIDKIGVKEGHRVHVDGVDDPRLWKELRARTSEPSTGRVGRGLDVIIVGVQAAADLGKLERMKRAIKDDGMIWAVWTKGKKELNEDHVREAALAIGLVDVKVVAVSDALSGLKLVIPVAKRSPPARGSRAARS